MMIDYKLLEQMVPKMAGIMNVLPGEVFRMKDEDTLLIVLRRMESCQLKEELKSFCEVFEQKKGCSLQSLRVAAVAFVKIKILVEKELDSFTPRAYRELIKEFHTQCTKVGNIIHLSEVNVMTADEYQKEKIELTMEKNHSFLEAFEIEIAAIEKCIERMPVVEEKEEQTKVKAPKRYRTKTEAEPVEEPKKDNLFSKLQKQITDAKERKAVDEKLKEVQKDEADTRCKEIPFYDRSLVFTEHFECKDIPCYSILKRKNNAYFGLSKNIGKTTYDNSDQSLIELTEVTDEFLQFMQVDLLSDAYELTIFSDKEKDGLTMYFNFMSDCFKKHIGVTLTVQEYLNFKRYYNRLVLRMFDLEKQQKEDYYRALILADTYMSYMESYDLVCADDEETVIANLVDEKYGNYADDLELIIQNHIVDEDARKDLEDVIQRMKHFHEKAEKEGNSEREESLPLKELDKNLAISQMIGIPQMMPMYPMGMNPGVMQIVIQILNQDREVVDEALYAGSNITQALYDYQGKNGYIKRLGFRNNGQDIFCKEEKEIVE